MKELSQDATIRACRAPPLQRGPITASTCVGCRLWGVAELGRSSPPTSRHAPPAPISLTMKLAAVRMHSATALVITGGAARGAVPRAQEEEEAGKRKRRAVGLPASLHLLRPPDPLSALRAAIELPGRIDRFDSEEALPAFVLRRGLTGLRCLKWCPKWP